MWEKAAQIKLSGPGFEITRESTIAAAEAAKLPAALDSSECIDRFQDELEAFITPGRIDYEKLTKSGYAPPPFDRLLFSNKIFVVCT